jgi:hypothetical protein
MALLALRGEIMSADVRSMCMSMNGVHVRRWLILAGIVIFTSAIPASTSGAQRLFVSPDGAGKRCDEKNPCSLMEVQRNIRTLPHGMSRDLIVSLAPGHYRLRQALEFGPADSGHSGHLIRWEGSSYGASVLDGALQIKGWVLVDAARNIWRASIPKGANTLQIYVNGTRAVPARHVGCVSPSQCRYNVAGLAGGGSSLGFLSHPEQVAAAFAVRWRDFRCHLQAVHGDDIVMAEPCWHNTVADSKKEGWSNASPKGKPFKGIEWFENAYEFLGKPGQFYIDLAFAQLYYVPRPAENLKNADVEFPMVEHLLSIHADRGSSVHDIEFKNMTFTNTDWVYGQSGGYVPLQAGYMVTGVRQALPDNGEGMVRIPAAVEVYGGLNLTFVTDTFQDLGAAGIALDKGTHHSGIERSSFHDLAGGAIFVGDTIASPENMEDRAGGNRVTRNTITRVALNYRDNVAIMGGFNNGLNIDHNSISEVPYTAISVGWGWNYEGEGDVQRNIHIHANKISDFMLILHDGGAIYTQAQSPGSSVTENFINYKNFNNGNGIYLDERSRKYEVCGNVVWNEAAKMQEGQWVSTWSSWSGDLNIHDNWSDDPHMTLHNPGPTKIFKNNHLGLKEMPLEAQAIVAASGAEGSDKVFASCAR